MSRIESQPIDPNYFDLQYNRKGAVVIVRYGDRGQFYQEYPNGLESAERNQLRLLKQFGVAEGNGQFEQLVQAEAYLNGLHRYAEVFGWRSSGPTSLIEELTVQLPQKPRNPSKQVIKDTIDNTKRVTGASLRSTVIRGGKAVKERAQQVSAAYNKQKDILDLLDRHRLAHRQSIREIGDGLKRFLEDPLSKVINQQINQLPYTPEGWERASKIRDRQIILNPYFNYWKHVRSSLGFSQGSFEINLEQLLNEGDYSEARNLLTRIIPLILGEEPGNEGVLKIFESWNTKPALEDRQFHLAQTSLQLS